VVGVSTQLLRLVSPLALFEVAKHFVEVGHS
jgi:hypothetical protein